MKRIPLYFVFTGIELVRYFLLTFMAGPLPASISSSAQILRLLAAPNILFAAAFFFLAVDRERYAVYQPLLIVGKAAAVFSASLALPGIMGRLYSGASDGLSSWALVPVLLWDIAATLVLLLRKNPGNGHGLPASPEPEMVETE
jgi:hypothetical protein